MTRLNKGVPLMYPSASLVFLCVGLCSLNFKVLHVTWPLRYVDLVDADPRITIDARDDFAALDFINEIRRLRFIGYSASHGVTR